MGHSSLLGTEQAATQPAGTDNEALGPSDNSDSGSDRVGIADSETTDPGLPVDVALDADQSRSLQPDSAGGADSDAAGTGERASAGGDAGLDEASDIGVDRVIDGPVPGATGGGRSDDEDADLAFVDAAQAQDLLDDDAELEREGLTRADLTQSPEDLSTWVAATPQPPPPLRPNPEPDSPIPAPDGELPDEADEAEEKRPGRA